ncbi:MAG: diguanylate cyclase [Planctomycetota bacterium]
MDLLATTHASLAIVNLVFALVALAIGFAAGAWVCGSGKSPKGDAAPKPSPADRLEKQIEVERNMMASDRLRDLAKGVASDVSDHNKSIGAIEANLAAAKSNGAASEADVVNAMASIAAANEALQGKLQMAEAQIKDQAEQIKTHESEARTDSLTALSNRRAFDDEMKRRLAEWHRNGTPLSLLIMDVDHFKKFNDTHGHQAGDEVLKSVGQALQECCRDMDMPCRYGGEEFAIVMPATEGGAGGTLAERVRKAIEAMVVSFEGKSLKVTMSLGLAQARSDEDSADLLKRADAALYESKDAGRNNAHLHNGEKCVPISPHVVAAATPEPAPAAAAPDRAPTVVLDALPNRTRFLENLRQGVRDAEDSRTPLTLLTTELEGHETLVAEFGDAVARLTLDSVAQFLDNALRDNDQLGRLGESQFVVLMPETAADEASAIAKRIGAALSQCHVPLGDRTLQLTTRSGVTELTAEDSAVTLMRRAEASLLLAEPENGVLV